MLVCINCARVVVFGPQGWIHRDGSPDCPSLVVAWPPPITDDQQTGSDAA